MKRPEIACDHMQTLFNCGGKYDCPVDADGMALGPIVPYAGTYDFFDEIGKKSEKKYVGYAYTNFAKAEIWSHVLRHFAENLRAKLFEGDRMLDDIDVFCGAPIGGYSLADALGLPLSYRKIIKAEKKVLELETATSRERSTLIFGRHDVEPGERVVIVEDVCNNFSTTSGLVGQITRRGASVVAIVCFLNRSTTVDNIFSPQMLTMASGEPYDLTHLQIPVVSLVRMPIPEFRQDDPRVAMDIARGNIVWNVKKDWDRLMQAMKDHSAE